MDECIFVSAVFLTLSTFVIAEDCIKCSCLSQNPSLIKRQMDGSYDLHQQMDDKPLTEDQKVPNVSMVTDIQQNATGFWNVLREGTTRCTQSDVDFWQKIKCLLKLTKDLTLKTIQTANLTDQNKLAEAERKCCNCDRLLKINSQAYGPETDAESDVEELELISIIEAEGTPKNEFEIMPIAESEVVPNIEPEVTPTAESNVGLHEELELIPNIEAEAMPKNELEIMPTGESEVAPNIEPEVTPTAESDVELRKELELIPNIEAEALPKNELEIMPTAESEVAPNIESEVTPTAESDVELREELELIPNIEAEATLKNKSKIIQTAEPDDELYEEPELIPNIEVEGTLNEELEIMTTAESEVVPNIEPKIIPNTESEVELYEEPESIPNTEAEVIPNEQIEITPTIEFEGSPNELEIIPTSKSEVELQEETKETPNIEAEVAQNEELETVPATANEIDLHEEIRLIPKTEVVQNKELEITPTAKSEVKLDDKPELLPSIESEVVLYEEPDLMLPTTKPVVVLHEKQPESTPTTQSEVMLHKDEQLELKYTTNPEVMQTTGLETMLPEELESMSSIEYDSIPTVKTLLSSELEHLPITSKFMQTAEPESISTLPESILPIKPEYITTARSDPLSIVSFEHITTEKSELKPAVEFDHVLSSNYKSILTTGFEHISRSGHISTAGHEHLSPSELTPTIKLKHVPRTELTPTGKLQDLSDSEPTPSIRLEHVLSNSEPKSSSGHESMPTEKSEYLSATTSASPLTAASGLHSTSTNKSSYITENKLMPTSMNSWGFTSDIPKMPVPKCQSKQDPKKYIIYTNPDVSSTTKPQLKQATIMQKNIDFITTSSNCKMHLPTNLCSVKMTKDIVIQDFQSGERLRCGETISVEMLEKPPVLSFFGNMNNELASKMRSNNKQENYHCSTPAPTYTVIMTGKTNNTKEIVYWIATDLNACDLLKNNFTNYKTVKGATYISPEKGVTVHLFLFENSHGIPFNNVNLSNRNINIKSFLKTTNLCGPVASMKWITYPEEEGCATEVPRSICKSKISRTVYLLDGKTKSKISCGDTVHESFLRQKPQIIFNAKNKPCHKEYSTLTAILSSKEKNNKHTVYWMVTYLNPCGLTEYHSPDTYIQVNGGHYKPPNQQGNETERDLTLMLYKNHQNLIHLFPHTQVILWRKFNLQNFIAQMKLCGPFAGLQFKVQFDQHRSSIKFPWKPMRSKNNVVEFKKEQTCEQNRPTKICNTALETSLNIFLAGSHQKLECGSYVKQTMLANAPLVKYYGDIKNQALAEEIKLGKENYNCSTDRPTYTAILYSNGFFPKKFVLHWMVTDLDACDMLGNRNYSFSDVPRAEYQTPRSYFTKQTGVIKVMFLLYRNSPGIKVNKIDNRYSIVLKDYVKDNGLCGPVAALHFNINLDDHLAFHNLLF